MKKLTTAQINDSVSSSLREFIAKSEDSYAEQLRKIALKIVNQADTHPILLLAGPSGAGKTSTALRLQAQLELYGVKAVAISMDNYYRTILPEDKDVDFESPDRLNIPLLNEHLDTLSRGGTVHVPNFDFANQRSIEGYELTRKSNEIILLEGIHALNPYVTGQCDSYASCMYVSIRTRIETEQGDLMHPSSIRLMRRLMRDKLFRGRAPEATFAMFENVSRGEAKYILPHKKRAIYQVDTFLPYEISVYKDILLPDLKKLAEEKQDLVDCNLILSVLSELEGISDETISGTSLVREFIGGSKFAY